ncbi:MAG: hypothetical protein R2705_21345 [Ilumatobacteraceae bacterium]
MILNVTATEPGADGYVTVWPCGAARPRRATSTSRAGGTVAVVVSAIGSGGAGLSLHEYQHPSLADITGYLPASSHTSERCRNTPGRKPAAGQTEYSGTKPRAGQKLILDVPAADPPRCPTTPKP